ncbi:pirin family protein [Pinisolibacter aquiterrae]|uniref:pirin family protein n=1 Tax=Pinisolibacter aquiterrae TaxID=2815579 RepID=UPI001C3C6D63|nr:pirin family protein [Pinisolibacter aquiterrae]MBV5263705.1 pirin family protein [Pinisolibacter aquiterrae]MCC8235097.1 pirin family protein [Pinisolibacter aquiterrae]
MAHVIRRAADRGRANFGWLDSRHTFSFGHYYDPEHMGFGPLRVINDDRVAAGGGFPTHPHEDMEIVSYVLEGGLQHRDSLGTGSVIRPGDVQRMSAGTGIRHSEFNASGSEPVHFLQIWIMPEAHGIAPSYEQTFFAPEEKRGRLRLVGSRDGRDGSVTIHQDVDLWATVLGTGEAVTHEIAAGRGGWIHVARGSVRFAGETLGEGDGVAIGTSGPVRLEGIDDAEVLLFDMAP